jgi:hypothetical protein
MYKLVPNVIYDVDRESNKKYLIDIENGTLFQLNETASMLVENIIDGKSLDEYVRLIKDSVDDDIDTEKIRNDVEIYINSLLEQGFICEINQ